MTKKSEPIEINVDEIDMELMKERTTDLPGLLEYAHTIGGFSVIPTKEGQIKSSAIEAMKGQTDLQMTQIYEQMQLLAKQAAKLKRRAEVSLEIYKANVRFKPVINSTYYLYENQKSEKILSMVAPEEWGKSIPFKSYLAKVKLLANHTWDLIEDNQDT